MSPAPDDPMTALNEVLSEVIDIVQEVKQAHRKVPDTHALHAALDQLFDDLRSWAELLMEEDEARGISALGAMPSVAGRTPPNLWPGAATDDEVRSLIDAHLDRLGQHAAAARVAQDDEQARTALSTVERAVGAYRETLSAL
jgi:DNA-binding ferritin-like protein